MAPVAGQVPWERLRVAELGVPLLVERVRVTFLDANHCPGAAMLLFEPPGRRPTLHTGDCRRAAGRIYLKPKRL